MLQSCKHQEGCVYIPLLSAGEGVRRKGEGSGVGVGVGGSVQKNNFDLNTAK